MRQTHIHIPRLHLFIIPDLLHVVDRTRRDPSFVQNLTPIRRRPRPERLLQVLLQRLTVQQPARIIRKSLILQQVLPPN